MRRVARESTACVPESAARAYMYPVSEAWEETVVLCKWACLLGCQTDGLAREMERAWMAVVKGLGGGEPSCAPPAPGR